MATHLRIHLGKERELYEQSLLMPAAGKVLAVAARREQVAWPVRAS